MPASHYKAPDSISVIQICVWLTCVHPPTITSDKVKEYRVMNCFINYIASKLQVITDM